MRVTVLALLLLVSCGGDLVTREEAAEVRLNGLNNTGLDLPLDSWAVLATGACDGEAWIHENAYRLADDLIAEGLGADRQGLATTLFLATFTACRERIPADVAPGPAPGERDSGGSVP
jgi:hypothetical protein